MSEDYFPLRNGRRGWFVTVIAAVAVALLAPSISAIIVIAQMHQKQVHFEKRLDKHDTVACHGLVCERLADHEAKLMGQGRSLDTVRHANDRLATAVYRNTTEIKLIEQRVGIEHNSEADE